LWEIEQSDEFEVWFLALPDYAKEKIIMGVEILRNIGPGLGRPWVDTIKGSKLKNLKELRIDVKQNVFRILFVFDPKRVGILLVGGDKRGQKRFYERIIPLAESIYDSYQKGE
jgi:hypothetical protein